MITNDSIVSVERLEGFCVDIFKEFVRLCPIQYRLYKNKDGKWGNFNKEKKQWDGMIGELVEAKADMGKWKGRRGEGKRVEKEMIEGLNQTLKAVFVYHSAPPAPSGGYV